MFKYKGRECIELSRNLFSPTLQCKAGKKTIEQLLKISFHMTSDGNILRLLFFCFSFFLLQSYFG